MRQTFRSITSKASYRCECDGCGKRATRYFTAEQTVNPYNKNDAGSVKSPDEIHEEVKAEAKRRASALEGSTFTCRTCAETPERNLLIRMADKPDQKFPDPEPRSRERDAMITLSERGHVERSVDRSPCCGCGRRLNKFLGWIVTQKGINRAAKFSEAQKSEARLSAHLEAGGVS